MTGHVTFVDETHEYRGGHPGLLHDNGAVRRMLAVAPPAIARELAVQGPYLCAPTRDCTCGGGGDLPHETHCGWEPVALVADVRRALEATG